MQHAFERRLVARAHQLRMQSLDPEENIAVVIENCGVDQGAPAGSAAHLNVAPDRPPVSARDGPEKVYPIRLDREEGIAQYRGNHLERGIENAGMQKVLRCARGYPRQRLLFADPEVVDPVEGRPLLEPQRPQEGIQFASARSQAKS